MVVKRIRDWLDLELASVTATDVNAESIDTGALSDGTVFAVDTLAADGTTDDSAALESVIENNEGQTIVIEEGSGAIKVDSTVAPSTTGDRTVLECRGNPTIDISSISTDTTSHGLSFANAPNVTLLGPVTIKSSHSDTGTVWGMKTSDGFRFRDVTLQTGSGGVNINGTGIVGDGLTVMDQRRTDSGTAAGVRPTNTSDVRLYNVEVTDSDRGIETEDNANSNYPVNDLLIDGFIVENIDNSGASSPGSQFSLDVHNHSGGSEIRNVTYRNGVVRSCATGINIENLGPPVEDITIENVRAIDSDIHEFTGDGVYVRNCTFSYPNTTSPNAVEMKGGRVFFESVDIDDPGSGNHGILLEGGGGYEVCSFRDVTIDGTFYNAIWIKGSRNVTHVTLENVELVNAPESRALMVGSDALDTTTDYEFGLEAKGCNFGKGQVDIASSNAPIRFENTGIGTDSINLTEFLHNGVGTESASAETPQGNWPIGSVVDFTDTGDDSGTGVYRHLSDGTWSQIGS